MTRPGWTPGGQWDRLLHEWYERGRIDGWRGWPKVDTASLAELLARAYHDGYEAGRQERLHNNAIERLRTLPRKPGTAL